MISRLAIGGGYTWSAWQPDRGMPFNSYYFQTPQGGVAIDPLPLDPEALDRIRSLGGLERIVLTNPDHRRAADAFAQAFGARTVTEASEGEEIFPGAFALVLRHGKTPEIAIHLREHRTAIVGDALIGIPAGSLSLLPGGKIADTKRFALELRRLWALELKNLLVGDGYSIFGAADAAIFDLLYATAGSEIFRINLDELDVREERESGKYGVRDAEAGLLIGARRLGYRVSEIPPGKTFCPLHWHVEEEEMFYVLDGTPSIRMASGTLQCRAGDLICFPVGERGAHQLLNESSTPARLLLLGLYADHETCLYPDSRKVLTDTREGFSLMVRAEPQLDYYDGEL